MRLRRKQRATVKESSHIPCGKYGRRSIPLLGPWTGNGESQGYSWTRGQYIAGDARIRPSRVFEVRFTDNHKEVLRSFGWLPINTCSIQLHIIRTLRLLPSNKRLLDGEAIVCWGLHLPPVLLILEATMCRDSEHSVSSHTWIGIHRLGSEFWGSPPMAFPLLSLMTYHHSGWRSCVLCVWITKWLNR